jgi:6-phosphogluconolactonase (cycloisomerase 2 family)
MRHCLSRLLVAIALCTGTLPAAAQDNQDNAETARTIDRLILELDSDNFQTREDAEKALAKLGATARDAVEKATRSTSAEVRQRATRILRELKKSSLGLKHVEFAKRDDMRGVCGIELSPDGDFVYAAAWNSSSINVFRRDAATGKLEHVQALVDPANLGGVVCMRISPDGKRAVATSFRSKTVVLFTRDPEKGTLSLAHSAGPDLAPGMTLTWPIHGVFSPDGKFVYAVDDRAGALAVFEATDANRLKFVQLSEGRDGCFTGARALAATPDGKSILVGGTRAGTLVVLDRDAATGKVEVRQVLTDEQDKITGLAGIHGIDPSPDGKHVYVTSGRFAGDQAIGAYAFGDDGKLSLLQEFVSDQGDLVGFRGGNKAALSADGKSLYVCGTVSQSLASFERDPATGKLTLVTNLHDATTGAGDEAGPANARVSPDGRFLYVTLESAGAISIFERSPSK